MSPVNKRLYRSNEGKMLCGVCAGIAEYLDIDPTVVRLIFALLACTGSGILFYIIAVCIMPEKPRMIDAG